MCLYVLFQLLINIIIFIMSNQSRSKSYCFTWNNWTDDSVSALHEFYESHCDYMVFGSEVAPTTGTKHLQGYMHLLTSKTMSTVHKQISIDGIALIVAKGSADANYIYCSKGGEFTEYGIRPSSGSATCKLNNEAYTACINFAKSNQLDEIERLYPSVYLRYHATFHRIQQDSMIPPAALDSVCGEWWYGEPGTGKSYKAYKLGCYDKEPNKWFGGYNGRDPIVIQDLDHDNAKWMAYHLKKWTDRYPFTAEVKGKQISIRPPLVIVTSNYTIRELFADRGEVLCKALERRFKCTRFTDYFITHQ